MKPLDVMHDLFKLGGIGLAFFAFVIISVHYKLVKTRECIKQIDTWTDMPQVLLPQIFSYTCIGLFVVLVNSFVEADDLLGIGAGVLKDVNYLATHPLTYIIITFFSAGLPAGIVMIKTLHDRICGYTKKHTSYWLISAIWLFSIIIAVIYLMLMPKVIEVVTDITNSTAQTGYFICSLAGLSILLTQTDGLNDLKETVSEDENGR